ncbi:MAG: hypothetical protein JSU96_16535, partial [Acidobacteriota bacterium]
QSVGSFGEPGSGERLAARLVTSLVEARQQEQFSALAAQAKEAAQGLQESVQTLLAEGLTGADPKKIEVALKEIPRRRASLSELSDKLASLGSAVNIDPSRTLQLAQTAHLLEEESWNLTEGPLGLGRSRFGIAVISERIAKWVGRYPNHSYQAPLIVEPSSEGIELVLGIARATVSAHVERIRLIRKAAVLKQSPPDMPGQLAKLEELAWAELSDEEKRSCPPIILLTDEMFVGRQSMGEFGRLLSSDLPVKVVILDSKQIQFDTVEPALWGVANQTAFTVATSVARTGHLADGIKRLADYPGPGLVHIHVPIPEEHGYTPSATLDRARTAIEARVHPLLIFDPAGEGFFGIKFELQGNPDGGSWGGVDVLEWARGERRFQSYFTPVKDDVSTVSLSEYLSMDAPARQQHSVAVTDSSTGKDLLVHPDLVRYAEHRLQVWALYRELGGVDSPFVDRIRAEVQAQIEAEQQAKFNSMISDYEGRISQIQSDVNGQMMARLREKLLNLAGFGQDNA